MQRKYGVILGYISLFTHNISSFLLLPLMISSWGASNFGIYKLVLSITAYFMLLDLGIGNSIIRFISEYRVKKERQKEQNFIAVIILFYAFASLVIILLGFTVPNLFEKIFRSLSAQELKFTRQLFTVLVINSSINLFFNTFNGIIKAYEAYIFLNGINIFKNIVRFFILFYVLKQGKNAYIIILVDLIINIIFSFINAGYVFLKLRVLPKFTGIKFSFFKVIYSYSLFIFLEMIAYQLFWSVDNLVLGIFTSSTIIAIYSIGILITSYFESFSLIIHNVTMPRIVQMVTTNTSTEALSKEVIKVSRIKLFVLGLPFIGFIFLGEKFICLWAGNDFLSAYYISIIVLIPQIIARVLDVISNIMWSKNRQKEKALISIVTAIINVFLTIILVQKIGMVGAAIGTAFAFLFGYVICEGLYVHIKIGINMVKIYKAVYKGTLEGLIITSLLSWLISKYIKLTWSSFIIQVVLISIIYSIVMWIFALNNKEKKMAKSIIYKRIN